MVPWWQAAFLRHAEFWSPPPPKKNIQYEQWIFCKTRTVFFLWGIQKVLIQTLNLTSQWKSLQVLDWTTFCSILVDNELHCALELHCQQGENLVDQNFDWTLDLKFDIQSPWQAKDTKLETEKLGLRRNSFAGVASTLILQKFLQQNLLFRVLKGFGSITRKTLFNTKVLFSEVGPSWNGLFRCHTWGCRKRWSLCLCSLVPFHKPVEKDFLDLVEFVDAAGKPSCWFRTQVLSLVWPSEQLKKEMVQSRRSTTWARMGFRCTAVLMCPDVQEGGRV